MKPPSFYKVSKLRNTSTKTTRDHGGDQVEVPWEPQVSIMYQGLQTVFWNLGSMGRSLQKLQVSIRSQSLETTFWNLGDRRTNRPMVGRTDLGDSRGRSSRKHKVSMKSQSWEIWVWKNSNDQPTERQAKGPILNIYLNNIYNCH